MVGWGLHDPVAGAKLEHRLVLGPPGMQDPMRLQLTIHP
jgi:hypothetical protein